jgi:phytoene synthase
VRTAHRLYAGILDQIERSDYDVLRRRVVVPAGERLAIAAPALGLAYAARMRDLVTGPSPGRGA